jgi:phenylalanyl-tRNA synthetase alpha chain
VTTTAYSISKGDLPAEWDQIDPTPLSPDHEARVAELRTLGAAEAAFYDRAARGLAGAPDLATLKERHTFLLGRERGKVTAWLAVLPSLPADQRKAAGHRFNLVKRWLSEMEQARRGALERASEEGSAGLDVTLPGRRPWVGHRHVLGQIQDELLDLFHGLGYSVYTSPEVEHEEYNFGKLNFPPDHPARDAHDTYWVGEKQLLRTHTSPGWVRAMEEHEPPLRLVFPGRVYRAEQVDASHMDQFHQIDGLFVGRNVSMADLKATLNTFARSILGRDARTRLIPVYFPFVEPGAQLDVACAICDGAGRVKDAAGETRCPVCAGAGWSELLGSGMVHPNVFRAVGYDPEEVTGFAFGMGLERIAMARHGIPEIRLFLENDLRFLNQF